MDAQADDWDSRDETDGDSSEETEMDSSEETEGDSREEEMDSSEEIEASAAAAAAAVAVAASDPSVDMRDSIEDSSDELLVDINFSEDMDSNESSDEPTETTLSLSVDMLERLLEGNEVMELAEVSELSSPSWIERVSSELTSPPPCMRTVECESSTTAVSRMSTMKIPMMVWIKVDGLRLRQSSSFFLARA